MFIIKWFQTGATPISTNSGRYDKIQKLYNSDFNIGVFNLQNCFHYVYIESEDRIVGGENAKRNEFPYQIRLEIDRSYLCGGSLISENLILSAAHCFSSNSKVIAIAGDHDATVTELTEQSRTVSSIKCHKSFNEYAFFLQNSQHTVLIDHNFECTF